MTRRQLPIDPLERALLTAVLTAPDDDAPRLVYADRLIERGHPRGELIVVQCAVARLEREGRTDTDEHRGLKLRESTLVPLIDREWQRELGAGYWRGTITRGFYTRVEIELAILRLRWRLFAALPLETLVFPGWDRGSRDGLPMSSLTWLARKPTALRAKAIVVSAGRGAMELDPTRFGELLREHPKDDPSWAWYASDPTPHPKLKPAIRHIELTRPQPGTADALEAEGYTVVLRE